MSATWVDRNEYPFKSRFINVPAGRLHYIDEGAGNHVLVMVHGNPTWSFSYRHLIKGLSEKYRCIALDHIGFGLSDKPRKWNYLPESHADNLKQLLNHLDIHSATMVVQDWGGPIGLSYALDYPDKIDSIIVMNSWCWPVKGDPHYERFSGFMGGRIGRLLIKRFNFFVRVIMKKAYGDPAKLTPAIHSHYLNALGTPQDRKGCTVLPKQIIGATHWLEQLWSQRSKIKSKPALILWGEKDIAFREKELAVWQNLFDQAEVQRFDNVGHFVQEELGPALCPLIERFLAQIKG